MFYALFLHLAHLASIGVMSYDEVSGVTIDVVSVVVDSNSTLTGSKMSDAFLLGTWIARESAGHGPVIGDKGASHGAMQIGGSWFAFCGMTPAELRSDRRRNIACGYDIMKSLVTTCGSVRGALRGYSSGKCSGTNSARAKVESRCKESGAC